MKKDPLMLHKDRFPGGAVLVLLPSILAFAFCGGKDGRGGSAAPANAAGADKSKVVLQVEGRSYTNNDFKNYLESVRGSSRDDDLSDEAMSRLFDRFVDDRLVLVSAAKNGLKPTAQEKREYWNSSGKQDAAGTTRPEDLPDDYFESLIIEKYMNEVSRGVTASDEDIKAYYEGHKKEYLLPERIKVSQIVVSTEEKAVGIVKKLRDSGEEEFRTLAAVESIGPEATRGGVMGTFKPGELPAEMEKVVSSMSPGRLSRVVESPYGYHIFRLDARYQPQLRPIAEVADRIKADILGIRVEEAMAVHLKSLKEMLTWSRQTENLFFTYRESEK